MSNLNKWLFLFSLFNMLKYRVDLGVRNCLDFILSYFQAERVIIPRRIFPEEGVRLSHGTRMRHALQAVICNTECYLSDLSISGAAELI